MGKRPTYKELEEKVATLEKAVLKHRKAEQVHAAQREMTESLSKFGTTDWHLPTGKVIWSDETYRIVGLDPEKDELTREYYSGLIHPEDKERVEQAYSDLNEDDRRFGLEYRIVRPDGTIRWLHVRGMLLYNSDGSPERILSSAIDITERVRNEEALQLSEKHLRQAQSLAGLGSNHWDLATDTIHFSDEMYRILGLDPKRTRPTRELFNSMVHPEDLESIIKSINGLTRENPIHGNEYRIMRPDGTERLISSWRELLFDDEGQPYRLLAACLDITDKKQTGEALLQSEDRFRSLFEDSPVALLEVDCSELRRYFDELRTSGVRNYRRYFKTHPDDAGRLGLLTRTMDVNQAAVTAFKAESREMLIEGFNRLGGKPFYNDWLNIVIAFAEGKRTYERDVRLHTFKGDIRNFAIKWLIPEGSRKTLAKVYIAAVDITNRKRMEQTLKRSESNLNRKAEKLEMTNIAMDVLLRKRLSDKKELEETMLYNLKELILPYLHKLKSDGLDPRQKTYVGILERNLDNIMSPFLRGMSLGHLRFTPSELQIVNCLREGMSTRQMAEFFDLSPRTVESYRDNIREKLGIKRKKLNLRTYLMAKA